MTFQDAERLQISGRYSELLRESTREQAAATREGRKADGIRWLLFAVKACRFIGRVAESVSHAARALEAARALGDRDLEAQAHHAQAVAFKSARRYDEALGELQAVIDILPAESGETVRAVAHLEMAEICFEAGLRPQAEAALARGSALVHWLREPRLLAWSLFLRSQVEEVSPADLQLSAAFEIARTVDCPELQWQILWRLSDRAYEQGRAKMQEDCISNALAILAKLAEPLEAADATSFWRQGSRRTFMEAVQKKFGPHFLQRVMLGGATAPENAQGILRDLGFDPATIPDFGRAPEADKVERHGTTRHPATED